MATYTVTRDGIELDLDNITFGVAGRTTEKVEEFCQIMWGEVAGVSVKLDGKFYVCDGVNPTTGKLFTPDTIEALMATFGLENVTVL